MDLATREANELLLKGKEALESAGNMKREAAEITNPTTESHVDSLLKGQTHTGEHVLQIIREAIDTKKSGAKVERVRKARNQKVILKCSTKEDMEAIQNKMRSRKEIKVEAAKAANPLLIMKGVMAYHKDADIIENVLAQNKHLVKDINLKEVTIRVRYRKRARNQLQCHPVLELSPSVHKRFLEAGKLYIDLQKVAVYDQSPLVQCAKCLGFGHTKAVCGEKTATCSYCADKTHEWEKCPRRKQNEEPKCKNCWENGIKTEANHEAFSNKCKVRQKWDEIARSRIAYC
ncbi:hypothetical protein EVAR_85947_1 [Eumeta japonica]|uniref:Nucleic-acid-binding protein from transposon X-element n=1 Tax=Eumeta variegata TaxID=151549 RepID=A0A4C1UJ45_EUMVA|nr:hypothetical protein EVAR_85947_1 [Eumeta japonica]